MPVTNLPNRMVWIMNGIIDEDTGRYGRNEYRIVIILQMHY